MKKSKIIIIGAGMAGLAAANALSTHCDVTLLEARDRYGGRIWIDHSFNVPLSRGAAWVHGAENNPITQLAAQFQTKLFFFDEKKFYVFDRQRRCIENKKIIDFNRKIEAELKQSEQFAWSEKEDISLSAALSHVMSINSLSYTEQDLFERKLKFFENYIGAEYELLSARHWDEEENLAGGHAFLSDSYEAILKGLSAACAIQFNCIVEAIHEKTNDIKIITNQGVLFADAVIVTVPLGVLKQKKIAFEPALSINKQQAINRLGMGLFNIIAMQFKTCFWPEDCRAFFLPGSQTCSLFFNVKHIYNAPILLGYVGGKTAHHLEKQDDQVILENTIILFKKFFKGNISLLENYFITRWSQDPFSLGSYSYLPVGATKVDRDILSQPESKRLFFAGEATHTEFPATVHGAYLSGIREAGRIKAIYCC